MDNTLIMLKKASISFFLLAWFFRALPNENSKTRAYIDLYYDVISRDTSCVEDLTRCFNHFESVNDTIWLTRSLVGMAIHETKDGNYGSAFANLWKALLYAEEKHDITLLHSVHAHLGRLYSIYDKNKEAFEHQKKALDYAKIGYAEGSLKGGSVVSAYYSLVLFYRKVGEYKKSMSYLDSCYYYADLNKFTDDQKAYLVSEKGHIFLRQGKLNEALQLFKESEHTFKRLNPGYLTIIYSYMGSAYEAMEDWSNAEVYFRKSIKNIDEWHDHFDVKAESLGYLANNLSRQNKFKEAYHALKEAKVLNDDIFSSKGFQNKGFLDIRNIYQEEVEQRDRIILERDNELILQKAKNLKIRLLLIGIFAAFAILFLFWYLRYSRKRLIAERESHQMKSELEQDKNRALVEMKNRELTSFTLQLIDKDSLINEIVGSVTKYAPKNDKLLKSVKLVTSGRLKLWEEFDKRFLDVNKGFYENLKTSYPDLTPTELKHCALIKLNFSAKEMAQLLNISINGVNTSRYRIRKKLNLDREDNLAQFIDHI